MLDADRPIQNSQQDRLGRTVFAKYLARCILDQTTTESLTIGLYGDWGSGKTSVINLALEELQFASNNMLDQEKPIILNFNVWNYASDMDFLYYFICRLSTIIREAEFFDRSEAHTLIKLLASYLAFFTNKPIYQLPSKKNWYDGLLKKKQRKNNAGWQSGDDLISVKYAINRYLASSPRKYIIFIDNVSRLLAPEILQLFHMLKSISDFSNTIYVIAFDKKTIIHALKTVYDSYASHAYLEKMVQLPFEIPPIANQDVEIILLERLKEIIKYVPENSWDSDYWADIYYTTLKYFFKNCRDITRYINTLSFGYPHVREVVNPVDFFAITAVEIFEPQVFIGIRENKDLFVDLFDTVYAFDAEKLAEDRARCDEILNRCESMPVEMLQLLLTRLFPRLCHFYPDFIDFTHSDAKARKYKRICTYDVFEIYFRLGISSGTISDAELEVLLSLSKDESGFALALLRLNQDERVLKFLDLLDSIAVHRIPTDYVANVLNALVDSADLFPQGENHFIHLNTPMRLHRIFHQLLKRFDFPDIRFTLFLNAIEKSINSLYIFIHELILQSQLSVHNIEADIPEAVQDFTNRDLDVLREAAVNKIREWATRGRLVEHPQLAAILQAWMNWGDPQETRYYIENMIKTDRGLIALLTTVFKTAIHEAMIYQKTDASWQAYLTELDNLVPLSLVLPRASELFKDDYFVKLTETEQLGILIFLDLARPNTIKVFPDVSTP